MAMLPAGTRRSRLPRLTLALLTAAIMVGCAADPEPSPSAPASPPSAPLATGTAEPAVAPIPVPTPEPPIVAPSPDGAYLALGDSVTFGIGVPDPRRRGFVGRLEPELRRADPPIVETQVVAVPGETAAGFLARRMRAAEAAIAELGPRIRLVTIGLGANEILRVRRHADCAEDRGSPACAARVEAAADDAAEALDEVLRRVIEALDAAGATPRILVLAYYNPDVEPIAAATIAGADGVVACDPADPSPGLNDRIACIAEDRGVELVDLYAAFLGREDELTRIAAGDVHPNAAGHAVIAETIAEHLGL